MKFPNLNTNFYSQNLSFPFKDFSLPKETLPITAAALVALLTLKQFKVAEKYFFRPLVETGKIGIAAGQGSLDGVCHGTRSVLEGIFSGTLGATIALALKTGTDKSYISPTNVEHFESVIFRNNPHVLHFARTYMNPCIQSYFNSSCLSWFFVGLMKAPIVNLFLHPPKHALESGAKRAAQFESAACYLGFVSPKKEESKQLQQIHENTAFFFACVVSGTISLLTGAIAFQTTHSPDFPNNLNRFLAQMQEMPI